MKKPEPHQKNLMDFEMEPSASQYQFNDDDMFNSYALLLKDVMQRKRELEIQESVLRHTLIKMTNGLSTRNNNISMLKCQRKGNIDYSSIPYLEGVDLEGYRKPPTEYWKFDLND